MIKKNEIMNKRSLIKITSVILIPLIMAVGIIVFRNARYTYIMIMMAFLSCVPFFLSFESKKNNSSRIVIVSIMTALSVVGRIVFAAIPGFKPVTAIVILTALYFGPEAGFFTGSLSALISNFYFSQGPWTPFQMFAWGLIGLIAGLISRPLKKSKVLLSVYGILSGIVFSCIMDVWTTFWIDGSFTVARFVAIISSDVLFMVEYALSNVVFLLILEIPLGRKIEKVIVKYDI